MKLIIAGGRDYRMTEKDWRLLTAIQGVTEVVSGCANGADTDGERWAAYRGLPVKRFPADWNKHGKSAGAIRNRQMADYADAVALFPGGKGTANMRQVAMRLGLTIYNFQ